MIIFASLLAIIRHQAIQMIYGSIEVPRTSIWLFWKELIHNVYLAKYMFKPSVNAEINRLNRPASLS